MEGPAGVITAISTLIAAIGALVVTLRNGQKANDAKVAAALAVAAAEDAKKEIVLTKDGIFTLGKRLDGQLTKLLELTRQAALAEGNLAGRAAATADGIAADVHAARLADTAAKALADAAATVEVPVATRAEREEPPK